MTETVPPRPLATYNRFWSGDNSTPIGLEPFGIFRVLSTLWAWASTTEMVPPVSELT